MSKTSVYKGLSIFAYIFSGITTLIFLVSFGVTIIDKLLGVIITALFEPSKPYLFIQIFKKHQGFIKTLIIGTWIFIEVASITASTSYMQNQTNKAYEKSPAYIAIKDKETNLKSLIQADKEALKTATSNLSGAVKSDSQTQTDNAKLVKDYNSNIQKQQAELKLLNGQLQDAINRNSKKPCPSTISRLKTEIRGKELQINNATKARDKVSNGNNVSDTRAVIEKLNASIEKNTKELNSIDYSTAKADKQTSGYMSVFIPFGKLIEVEPELLSLIFFFLIFGIVPELLGNLFFYLHKKENGYVGTLTNTNVYGQKEAESQTYIPVNDNNGVGSPVMASKQGYTNNNDLQVGKHSFREFDGDHCRKVEEKQIGFKVEPVINGISDTDLRKYLDYMYKHQKDNISPGYQTISRNIDIDLETCRKIKAYLERTGKVETVGRKTVILGAKSI